MEFNQSLLEGPYNLYVILPLGSTNLNLFPAYL